MPIFSELFHVKHSLIDCSSTLEGKASRQIHILFLLQCFNFFSLHLRVVYTRREMSQIFVCRGGPVQRKTSWPHVHARRGEHLHSHLHLLADICSQRRIMHFTTLCVEKCDIFLRTDIWGQILATLLCVCGHPFA